MRLFTKIFLFGMLAFGGAFSVSGYFLLHYSMKGSMSREVDFALKQYQYDKFTVQSAALTYLDVTYVFGVNTGDLPGEEESISFWQAWPERASYPNSFLSPSFNGSIIPDSQIPQEKLTIDIFHILAEEISVPAGFFMTDKAPLYSEIEGLDPAFLDTLSKDSHAYQFQSSPGGDYILVGSIIKWDSLEDLLQNENDKDDNTEGSAEDGYIYFVTQWDISKTMDWQDTLRHYFTRCYLIAMAVGMILLGFLSALLTGPLKRMSKAAGHMAEGCYEERLDLGGSDEMGTLAENFNRMAEAVEEKINQLSKSAREKDDFVANFAHELKTPLTSIIGYADTIYQKELSREELRRASLHIWNEGMRLEALSLKLMELTVLGSQDFPLLEMSGEELLKDVAEGFSPILQEKQVTLHLQAAPARVRADYDLLKTLLLNLMDNSIKAGCSHIYLNGEIDGDRYLISVEDNGCGMEQEELSRITEAFYMVDKARSRKQHGAGLGLALAERIARVHGSALGFESKKGSGTRVSFCLDCGKEKPENENQEKEG